MFACQSILSSHFRASQLLFQWVQNISTKNNKIMAQSLQNQDIHWIVREFNKLLARVDNQRPKYRRRTSTPSPRYLRRISNSAPPLRRISSSSGVHSSLESLVSMQLSSSTRSPESWSNFSMRVLMGMFTILEQIFSTSFSYLQLVGTFLDFLEAFSCFLLSGSAATDLALFLSSFLLAGSLCWILSSSSSQTRYPSTPSFSIQFTILIIAFSSILYRQSWYRDLRLSAVLLSLLPLETSSKVLTEMGAWLESSDRSSRSSCNLKLLFLDATSTGFLEARAFLTNQLQVMSGVFLSLGCSGSRVAWGALRCESKDCREPTTWMRVLVSASSSDMRQQYRAPTLNLQLTTEFAQHMNIQIFADIFHSACSIRPIKRLLKIFATKIVIKSIWQAMNTKIHDFINRCWARLRKQSILSGRVHCSIRPTRARQCPGPWSDQIFPNFPRWSSKWSPRPHWELRVGRAPSAASTRGGRGFGPCTS